jgi:Protein of unknown function (DUF2971)
LATIKSYVQPAILYRYRSLKRFSRELEAIEKGYLFCASFTALNDPMEGSFAPSLHLRESKRHRAIRKSIIENKAQMGICSFSEVPNHELMWAHYADEFRGVCVAYSLPRLLKHLPGDISFVRMSYNETEPTIHRSQREPEYLARRVLSYKGYKWLYEREWRMFSSQGKAYYGVPDCVTSVFLGFRILKDHREELKTRLGLLNISVRQMTIKSYSIAFGPRR